MIRAVGLWGGRSLNTAFRLLTPTALILRQMTT